ncbi:MAG: hypothetical protein ACO4B4_05535, partial [Planctomycetota bacterium]
MEAAPPPLQPAVPVAPSSPRRGRSASLNTDVFTTAVSNSAANNSIATLRAVPPPPPLAVPAFVGEELLRDLPDDLAGKTVEDVWRAIQLEDGVVTQAPVPRWVTRSNSPSPALGNPASSLPHQQQQQQQQPSPRGGNSPRAGFSHISPESLKDVTIGSFFDRVSGL